MLILTDTPPKRANFFQMPLAHRVFSKLRFFLLSLLLIIGVACNDIIPVWVGEVTLNDYTLYYSDYPREFEIDLSGDESLVPMRLELTLTYYVGIGRTDLPLYLILEDENHEVREFHTTLNLKADNQWQGSAQDNEIDYTITHEAISELQLDPQKYKLKIYANDDEIDKIYGIVKLAARLYELDSAEAASSSD